MSVLGTLTLRTDGVFLNARISCFLHKLPPKYLGTYKHTILTASIGIVLSVSPSQSSGHNSPITRRTNIFRAHIGLEGASKTISIHNFMQSQRETRPLYIPTLYWPGTSSSTIPAGATTWACRYLYWSAHVRAVVANMANKDHPSKNWQQSLKIISRSKTLERPCLSGFLFFPSFLPSFLSFHPFFLVQIGIPVRSLFMSTIEIG